MKDPLDRSLKAHYEAQRLDADTLRLLKDVVEADRGLVREEPGAPSAAPERPRLRLWRAPASWAVAAVIALLCALSIPLLVRDVGEEAPAWPRQVAAEIALNHNKQLAPEFTPSDFSALRASMPKLDFTPVRPARIGGAAYRLVGARYCSVGGAIAVQIHLVDAAGRPCTLYQFRGAKAATAPGEAVLDVDGVRVTLWQEAGLVMGMARPMP